jgi:hypothetical protein
MPAREQFAAVDVDTLRAAAATRAAATSITEVAKEVGLTTRGMNLFLQGAEPYLKTRQKLEQWYVALAGKATEITHPEIATAALSVLTHDIPPAARPAVIADAVRWWAARYADLGIPRPKWIEQLEARLAAAADTDGTPTAPRRRRRHT